MNKYYSSTEIRARDPDHGPDIRLKSDALDQWFPTFWVLSPGAGTRPSGWVVYMSRKAQLSWIV